MGSLANWIEQGLAPCSEQHQAYLKSRGVDQNTSISFYTWKCPSTPSPCQKFSLNFGATGGRIKDQLITPIYSPRGSLLGFEAREFGVEGKKKVLQYRTNQAQWNPYFLNSEKAFASLWGGCDLYIVEGIFDLVALEKVVPKSDAVISTLRAGMDNNSFNMISRFLSAYNTIYIAYDNDETGRNKSSWLKSKFESLGGRVYLPKYRGKDPNQVWEKGGVSMLRRMFC